MTDNTELAAVETAADPATPVTVEQLEAALKGTTDASKAEAPAEDVAPKDEAKTEESDEAAQPAADVKPKKGYFAKRIEEMTWRQREAERERDAARQELEALKAQPRSAGHDPDAPDVNDKTKYPLGEFDQQYARDLARYEARSEVRAEMQRQSAERERAEKVQRREAFEAKITEKDEGAYRLLNDPEMSVSEAMVEVISTSDHGVRLADYLGRKPDECARIAKLSPTRQAYELGKIEAKLTAPPPISKAPAPVPTVGARAQTQRRPEDMTQSEYNRWRDEQDAARKRA